MIKCLLAVCAQSVLRDADTNTVSIISILEELNLPSVPGILASLTAVFFLQREPADADRQEMIVRVAFADQSIQDFPVTVDFQGKLRSRAFVTIGGLPITGPGILKVGLAASGSNQLLAVWDVCVNVIGAPVVVAQSG